MADQLHAKAGIALDLGRLDEVEQYAKTAADTFSPRSRREAAGVKVTRAIIYTRAGEPGAYLLAEKAIGAVDGLASMRRRAKLAPLESALMRRADSTGLELARWARAVRTGS